MLINYMIGWVLRYFDALGNLFLDLWIWMFAGFLVAGIISEFVPPKKFIKYFGKNDIKSLLRATFAGLFTSFCSCGAIPIAVLMRKRSCSTATTLTFLLATPWAGFLHLSILAGFVGIKNTIILFSFALLVSFLSGLVFRNLENKKIFPQAKKHVHKHGEHCEICEFAHEKEPLKHRLFVCIPRNIYHILTDAGKYIIIGLLIAAVLKAFVPVDLVTNYLGNPSGKILPVLISVPIASVIELCSEGFTILAGQLYKMGATLGVVFAMTLVGVATDFTEISMICGEFSKKTALIYLLTSTSLTVVFALFINFLF